LTARVRQEAIDLLGELTIARDEPKTKSSAAQDSGVISLPDLAEPAKEMIVVTIESRVHREI
jgi:hypothetical protein